MRPRAILCGYCEEECGRVYPETGPTYASGGEPAYEAGKGEDFEYDGEWHCNEKCREAARRLKEVDE